MPDEPETENEIDPLELTESDIKSELAFTSNASEVEDEPYVAPVLVHKSLFTVGTGLKDNYKPWDRRGHKRVDKTK